jgi:hypothetical protein
MGQLNMKPARRGRGRRVLPAGDPEKPALCGQTPARAFIETVSDSEAVTERHRDHRRDAMSRNERMAGKLESIAEAHERDAERRERAGDILNARRASHDAAAARRAAAILAAGPAGIRNLFAA